MASNYPDNFDDFPTITADKLLSDEVGGRAHRRLHNDLGEAVMALQVALGTKPGGRHPSVLRAVQAAMGPLYGGSGANTAKWRAALQRVRTSPTGRARIICAGTSNTFGWGPATTATMNWPELLRQNI